MTTNIYMAIMIGLKFIMFYIFFSLVYTVYMEETRKKEQTELNLEKIHWTVRLRQILDELKKKFRSSKPPTDKEEREEKRRHRQSAYKKHNSTRDMLRRNEAKTND